MIFYVFWMAKYSFRKSKNHKIVKYRYVWLKIKMTRMYKMHIFRRNLYTLKENTFLAFSLLLYGFLEQTSLKILESLSASYEPDQLFTIWWTSHLVIPIVFILFKNCYVLFSAFHEYPEFFGYQGKTGTVDLRPIEIVLERGEMVKRFLPN